MGLQSKVGGKFHLKLNICKRPIVNKYREGKMKRTLKRELKVLETAKRIRNRGCWMGIDSLRDVGWFGSAVKFFGEHVGSDL